MSVQVISEEDDFTVQLASYLECWGFVPADVLTAHHEGLLLRVSEVFNCFSPCLGDLDVEGCLFFKCFIEEFDSDCDIVGDIEVYSNIGLQVLMISLVQLESKRNLGV